MAKMPMHNIALLPPSDFKDLFHLLQQHFTTFNLFSERSRDARILDELAKQRRKIDTHYGWVLASDSVLVGRMVNEDAKVWVKSLHESYDKIGIALDRGITNPQKHL
jgi:hypothetical protein